MRPTPNPFSWRLPTYFSSCVTEALILTAHIRHPVPAGSFFNVSQINSLNQCSSYHMWWHSFPFPASSSTWGVCVCKEGQSGDKPHPDLPRHRLLPQRHHREDQKERTCSDCSRRPDELRSSSKWRWDLPETRPCGDFEVWPVKVQLWSHSWGDWCGCYKDLG